MALKKSVKKFIKKKVVKKKTATKKAVKKKVVKLENMTIEELEKQSQIALINQRRAQEEKISLENEVKQGVLIVKEKAVADAVAALKEYDDNITKFVDNMPELLFGKSKSDIKEILSGELDRSREAFKNYMEGLL